MYYKTETFINPFCIYVVTLLAQLNMAYSLERERKRGEGREKEPEKVEEGRRTVEQNNMKSPHIIWNPGLREDNEYHQLKLLCIVFQK